MTDAKLRSGLIRLAHDNPSLRPHLLPLLKEAASGPTVFEGIMDALEAMAEYVHNEVTRSRFEGLELRPVGRSGSYGYGFSGKWTSQYDPRDAGALEVSLIWDASKKRPKVYMSARWDRYTKPIMEEVEFGMEQSAAYVARWVENNIMAFEQNVAYGANRTASRGYDAFYDAVGKRLRSEGLDPATIRKILISWESHVEDAAYDDRITPEATADWLLDAVHGRLTRSQQMAGPR